MNPPGIEEPLPMPAREERGLIGSRAGSDELLTGDGRFCADLHRPGQVYLSFVRSPHAHARIVAVDTAAALALPGVVAVWSAIDLLSKGVRPMSLVTGMQRADGSAAVSAPRHVLAHQRVRHVGEAVAVVVASSLSRAREGADAVSVAYESLPCVVDPVDAMKPGAPQLCDAATDNIAAYQQHGDANATARSIAGAAHVTRLELWNQRIAACSMETRGLLVDVDPVSGALTAYASTQMPLAVRDALVFSLPGLAAGGVRVRVGHVGGGFGMKTVAYPEDVVTAFAAMQLSRPVQWIADRNEDFLAALHARDLRTSAELALDSSGRVLALRLHSVANVGAYATMMGVAIPLAVGPMVATNVYDIADVDIDCVAVMTNTAPVGAYRGAGQPEAIYVIERLMDAAAREMGIDSAELRRRNMIRPQQMPYRNPLGQIYDSAHFEKMLDQALQRSAWIEFESRRSAALARGRLRGRGLASFLSWTGAFALDEAVRCAAVGDGSLEILSGAQETGQGIVESLAKVAADALSLPLASFRIVQGDTERIEGFGSGGSRSLFTGGAAVVAAADALLARARCLAAEALEVAEQDIGYRDGRFEIVGTDRSIGLFELASGQTDGRIEVAANSSAAGPSWPNACHVCEVEVDPQTGSVVVASYLSVNDIGRVIHPPIAKGQIEGAALQGIGQALYEQIGYDPATGQLLTGSFMDYCIASALDAPAFETHFDTSLPALTNALGAKGAGELGTIGATAAVANAVIDALARTHLGHRAKDLQMPFSADRIFGALVN